MANDLIQKNAELGRFLFCERYTLQPVKNALYIAEGQDLKRGAVVDVKGVLVGTNNSLMPYAVLENDCDTRAKGAFASVFVKGEFNFDKLFFADGLSKNDIDNIVYNGSCIGLVFKPYDYDADFSPSTVLKEGSFNPVTSDAVVKAIDEVTLDPSAVALGNVHLLDEVTELPADGCILIDSETNGPGEMSKDKLLELTAQNALAGRVAPTFIPNTTNAKAGNPYVYGNNVYVANEDYTGDWDASKFDQLPLSSVVLKSLRGRGRLKAGMFNNDLNSLPDNTIYACTDNTDGESFSHRPSTEIKQFTIITMSPNLPGGDGNCVVQILNAVNGIKFMRSCWATNSWSEWINLSNVLTTVHIASSPSSPYNDLDTYPKNSVVLYTNSGEVAHSPVTNGFNVFTFGADASVLTQILTSQSGEKFIRTKWGSWTQWTKITDFNLVVNPTTSSSPWNDLDNYPLNSAILVSSGESSVAHKPTSDAFTCLTTGAQSAAMTQILSTVKRVTWVRSKWGSTWGEWVQVKSYLDYNDVLAAFTNIVCVGDSLTYSQVYTSENGSRQAYKPWPSVLETITGATTSNLGSSGDDAIASWNRWKNVLETKTNALAIVYLGTNYGFTDTLDTDAPSDADPSTWDDTTNTGCYALIINKLQQLGYKVLLIKPWVVSSPGVLSATQKVVDDAGQRFGCTVVGPISNSSDEYHLWPDRGGRNNTHMNDLGYAWFAHELVRTVSSAGDNMKWIIPS